MELSELSLKTKPCRELRGSSTERAHLQQVLGSEVSGLKPRTDKKHQQIGLDFCERLLGMMQEEQREECSGV